MRFLPYLVFAICAGISGHFSQYGSHQDKFFTVFAGLAGLALPVVVALQVEGSRKKEKPASTTAD